MEGIGRNVGDFPASLSSGATSTTVLAIVGDEQSESALRSSLRDFTDSLRVRRGTINMAISVLEKEAVDGVLIVDVSGSSEPMRDLDNLARVCRPNLRVLVVGDNTDISFYRALVNDLGVAEYLPKPLTRGSVTRLFGPHIVGSASFTAPSRGGRAILFCGARGGVGATTLAVNVASHLATLAHTHVALLDLHMQAGAVALLMGTKPSPGLRTALEAPGRADGLFLDRVSAVVDDRLRVIAAEEPFDVTVELNETAVVRVVDLLRQRSNFVIIDMPTPPPPEMRALLAEANLTVLVCGPDLVSVRNTLAMRTLISSVAGKDNSFTVINRAGMPGGLEMALLTKGLAAAPDVVIPELGKQILNAEQLGVPAVRECEPLRRALAPLVQEISGVEQKSSSGSWLERMFRK